MREFTVDTKNDDRKIYRYLMAIAPSLSMGDAKKALRLKRVRINGKPAHEDDTVNKGDTVNVYLSDDCFTAVKKENKLLANFRPHIEIEYEDENILIVNKRAGLRVHPDKDEKVDTLVTHVQAYLYQKGEYDGTGFAPALCNRIDRFTGGLVIAAKNETALKIIDNKIRTREIDKYYLALCSGLVKKEGEIKSWLVNTGKRVNVYDTKRPDSQEAVTYYRLIEYDGENSLIECRLLTGRTHQIRAQFAHIGHPLIGDTQYGDKNINARSTANFQQLYSYKLIFDFKDDAGILNYLSGMEISVKKLNRGFSSLNHTKKHI